ncbi:hypothetical protein BDR03DRAFT_949158 [Suillus americanus]|nr:hypothetical protein BDR03DRAFT_949158 [Suillus americanus]
MAGDCCSIYRGRLRHATRQDSCYCARTPGTPYDLRQISPLHHHSGSWYSRWIKPTPDQPCLDTPFAPRASSPSICALRGRLKHAHRDHSYRCPGDSLTSGWVGYH